VGERLYKNGGGEERRNMGISGFRRGGERLGGGCRKPMVTINLLRLEPRVWSVGNQTFTIIRKESETKVTKGSKSVMRKRVNGVSLGTKKCKTDGSA